MAITELSIQNQFSFVCPIFNVATRYAACVTLRQAVYAGKAPDVRRGCQACMASSKCPAIHMINESISAKAPIDAYMAKAPATGKVKAEVLERILPVMVQQRHIDLFLVSPVEADLIATANDRIAKQLGGAPRTPTKIVRMSGGGRPTPKPAPSIPSINQAAATGDLAAAIS